MQQRLGRVSYQSSLLTILNTFRVPEIDSPETGLASLLDIYVDRQLLRASHGAVAQSITTLIRSGAEPLLITGPRGSGLSLLLRRAARALAAAVPGVADQPDPLSAEWQSGAPLPILLSLDADLPVSIDPWELIYAELERGRLALFAPQVRAALDSGAAALLIDGGDCPVVTVESIVRSLAARYVSNRLIVALPAERDLPGMAHYQLQPFDKQQLADAAARWMSHFAVPDAARAERITIFSNDLLANDRLFELVKLMPKALVIAALVAVNGRSIVLQRDEIYRRLIDHRLIDAPNRGVLRLGLGLVARALHRRGGHDVAPSLPRQAARDLLAAAGVADDEPTLAAMCRTGLLELAPDGETVSIGWSALRDYLAAETLARDPQLDDLLPELSRQPHWHEALALAVLIRDRETPGASLAALHGLVSAGAGTDQDRRVSADGSAIIRRSDPVQLGSIAVDRASSIVLAAQCLKLLGESAERYSVTREDARRRLLDLMGHTGVALPERIAAGLLLGDLGDPRFEDLLPPLAHIPGGAFVLGAAVAGFEDEGPPQRVDIPPFKIGVYPVTNGEYARFLRAVPGEPLPTYWHDPRLNNPSLPVVGVTWHQACGYAAWLTAELAARDLLPGGHVVRLPLESEWEKAATWGPHVRRKHAFPWGEAWETGRANTAEGRGAWMTTPVGCYPHGKSPYGVYDLIGNIWEWTASRYASYSGSPMPFERKSHYVLRGSSCVTLPEHARATYRSSHLPREYWRYHLGFRIVIGRPVLGM